MLLTLWAGIVSGFNSGIQSFSVQAGEPLVVSLQTGTFRGISTPGEGTEKWLGIPFAEPPVGPLRFKAPVPIAKPQFEGVRNASSFGNACPQIENWWLNAKIAEDCLFLNIWRPQDTPVDAKLPVLFWIHVSSFRVHARMLTGFLQGGSFAAASNVDYDPTHLIARSVAINKPIIYVSTNYRLNTFGFLASADVAPEDLNAGLLDQRMALEFVQTHIGAFGGDPSKVTIWGQSAGAGSVESHFLYPPNHGRPLFRAGIADSSTGPFKNSPNATTYDRPGKPFAELLSKTGCAPGAGAVACLQQLPFEELVHISNGMIWSTLNSQLWQPSIAPGSMIPERASSKIARGDFLHLPYLAGTNLNEGTKFSSAVAGRNLSGPAEDEAFKDFINRLLIDHSPLTADVYNKTLRLYRANENSFGAQFNTNDSLYDRAAAWYGDNMFLAPRRNFFRLGSPRQPMFAYVFRDGGSLPHGVSHGSELGYIFGGADYPLANRMKDFYLNFVYHLTPGDQWPAYTLDSTRQVMQLMTNNVTMIPDDWDLERTEWLNSQLVLDEFQKRGA
ncbi:alpha/beta-hydrolase [Mycena filopes]|nr:alpha/beta-hydrolase [Mycena filopes]